MNKPEIRIKDWSIRFSPRRGGMELTGFVLDKHHTNPYIQVHDRVYTSKIVDIDVENFKVETLNTIYLLENKE